MQDMMVSFLTFLAQGGIVTHEYEMTFTFATLQWRLSLVARAFTKALLEIFLLQ